jgi:hypothetical protein
MRTKQSPRFFLSAVVGHAKSTISAEIWRWLPLWFSVIHAR